MIQICATHTLVSQSYSLTQHPDCLPSLLETGDHRGDDRGGRNRDSSFPDISLPSFCRSKKQKTCEILSSIWQSCLIFPRPGSHHYVLFQSWRDLRVGLPPLLLVQRGLWQTEDPGPASSLHTGPGGGAQPGGAAGGGHRLDHQPPGLWGEGAPGQS